MGDNITETGEDVRLKFLSEFNASTFKKPGILVYTERLTLFLYVIHKMNET
jgi:hypothetical protein